jgi:hypothetical protein
MTEEQFIDKFKKDGEYSYSPDKYNNFIFDINYSSYLNKYLSIDLHEIQYKNNKINMLFNTDFEEFVPESEMPEEMNENLNKISNLENENSLLKNELNNLISEIEDNSSEANQIATKDVILELRKLLGQGRVDSDFSEDFPYMPIRKDK